MSIAPDLDHDRQPPDTVEFDDFSDEALYEAQVCRDVGFEDRVFTARPSAATIELDAWLEAHADVCHGAHTTVIDPAEALGRDVWLDRVGSELNRGHARFLAAVHQVGHAEGRYDPPSGRPVPDPFAANTVGAALGHSTAMAAWWLCLATAVIERVPAVWEAMAAGWLDLAKARVLVEDTRDMPRDLARLVVAHVLSRAPGLSRPQLAEQVEVTAGQLDHDWSRRREQAARSRVRVEYLRNPAGTADVALRDLGVPDAARIRARVDALVEPLRHAARRAGLKLGRPALRALCSQRLLDGSYAGCDDDTLLDGLIGELPAWHSEITGTGPDDSDPDDGGPDDGGPDGGGPDGGGRDGDGRDGGGPDGGGPDGGGRDGGGPDDGGPDGPPDDGGPDPADRDIDHDGEDDGPDGGDEAGVVTGRGGRRAGTVELRMRLSTALGLDDLPGELPGFRSLTAHTARRMLHRIRDGDVPVEWRVVLVDPDGYLDHVLLARPDPPRRTRSRTRSRAEGLVIVELAAPTTMVAALDPAAHPRWARLIRHAQSRLIALAEQGGLVGGPHHPATSTADAGKRFPGAALARFVRVRDRRCIGPLCGGRTHDAEIDHTRDWVHYGLSVAGNLGPPCRRCHRLKHEGHWHLSQPSPGTFEWRTPLGATHTIEARRVLDPAAAPVPRADGRPRRVTGGSRVARPGFDGWIDRQPRPSDRGHDIPAPHRTRPTSGYGGYGGYGGYDDEPPY